jgi:hypothetical protein
MRVSRRSIFSLLRIMAMVAGLVLLAPINPGRATDGRDFAGFYEVSNVTDLGDTVRVTLTVRVRNYSDADVSGATVTLQDSVDFAKDYGAYPESLSVANRESARLSGEFTLSREEYGRWQDGNAPTMRIDYQDADGNHLRRMIELVASPVGE